MNKSFKSFVDKNLPDFLKELQNEWYNQDKKFPNQTHTLDKWLVIIVEEIGEICKESLELYDGENFDIAKIYKEIIQSITLLIRLRYSIYSIDIRNKLIII